MGHKCVSEQWETVETKMGQGQLWKIMCVRREEGKKNILFFSVKWKNGAWYGCVCVRTCAGGCKNSKSCGVPCGTSSAWTTGKVKR